MHRIADTRQSKSKKKSMNILLILFLINKFYIKKIKKKKEKFSQSVV